MKINKLIVLTIILVINLNILHSQPGCDELEDSKIIDSTITDYYDYIFTGKVTQKFEYFVSGSYLLLDYRNKGYMMSGDYTKYVVEVNRLYTPLHLREILVEVSSINAKEFDIEFELNDEVVIFAKMTSKLDAIIPLKTHRLNSDSELFELFVSKCSPTSKLNEELLNKLDKIFPFRIDLTRTPVILEKE